MVANRVQDALGADDNASCCSTTPARSALPRMDKLALARTLVAEIARRLPASKR